MALLRPRRAPRVRHEVLESREQEIAEPAQFRIGLVKEIIAQTGGEELLHIVPGVFLAAARTAEVAIDRFPVAPDQEVEKRASLGAGGNPRYETGAIRASGNLLQRVSAKPARLGSGPDVVLVRDDCEGLMLKARSVFRANPRVEGGGVLTAQ